MLRYSYDGAVCHLSSDLDIVKEWPVLFLIDALLGSLVMKIS